MTTVEDNGAGTAGREFEHLRDELAEAGRALWLAGLGAARRVEEEGRGLFDSLVERGRKVERRQFKAIDRTVAESGRRVRDLSERVEGAVREALQRFGVATREDLETLSRRIEALDRELARELAERG